MDDLLHRREKKAELRTRLIALLHDAGDSWSRNASATASAETLAAGGDVLPRRKATH